MIPLSFFGHYTPEYWEQVKADRPKPVVVEIHGHCWVNGDHVIKQKVIKKEKDDPQTFKCAECGVSEKVVRCKKRSCVRETVSA